MHARLPAQVRRGKTGLSGPRLPAVSLPARSYFAYVPEAHGADPLIAVFCDWLEEQGRRTDTEISDLGEIGNDQFACKPCR